jgi:N-acyl-D-amino-acid deacylase
MKLLLIFFSLAFALPSIAQTSIQQVDRTVEAFLKRWNVPGASVAIVSNDRLMYAKGYGYANKKTRERVTPTHLFRIASLSKPITAVAILQLVEAEKLRLDDKVFGASGLLNKYGEQRVVDRRVLDITGQDLLNHSGGWDRDRSGDPMFNSLLVAEQQGVPLPPDQSATIDYVLRQRLDFSPGTKYAYSNFGYCLLGRIVEAVTGVAYEQYVKDQVLSKCGIKTMEIGLSNATLPHEVSYYTEAPERFSPSVFTQKRVKMPYGGFYLEGMDSHGGWIASSVDLMKFLVRVNGLPHRQDILRPSTLQTMTNPPPVNPNYALGWAVNEADNWWHLGSLPGASSVLARINDGRGWCVLLNKRSLDPNFFSELDQLMWQALDGVSFGDADLFNRYP